MPRPRMRTRQRGQHQTSSPGRRQQNQVNTSSPRQELTRRLAGKPVGKRQEDSDDSDKLVTKGAGGRNGRFIPVQEIFASGAVAGADKPGAHPTRTQRKRTMAQAMKNPPSASSKPQELDIQHTSNDVQEKAVPKAVPQAVASQNSNGIVQSAQPTPSGDASMLEGFNPRKRQLSILHTAQLDSSALDLSNDSFALPDDESTPVQTLKRSTPTATPDAPKQQDSATLKRKSGSLQPVRTAPNAPSSTEKIAVSSAMPAPEPSLPPQSISALRTSGRKQRRQTFDVNDEDVMAPPLSSSSSASPIQPASSSKANTSPDRPHVLKTEELQALMPNKRRRMTRHRVKASEFDIPADSTSDPIHEADDSFLPSKRQGKRQKAPAVKRKPAAKPKKMKAKPSTSASRPLQPAYSSRSNTTKSPTPTSFLGGSKAGLSSHVGGQSGGSPLKVSVDKIGGKENEAEVLVARSDDEGGPVSTSVGKNDKPRRSVWDDIDDFEMDFEDVSVYERSSDVNAR